MSDLVRRGDHGQVRSTRVGPSLHKPTAMLWRTMEGEVLRIEDMETGHLFNSMKMIFNHIASMWGGEPVWFGTEYSDYLTRAVTGRDELARQVVVFLREIDTRHDLPEKYREPLEAIKRQVLPGGRAPQLPAPPPRPEDYDPDAD